MNGNVRLTNERQFDELRIAVEKSFNKLRKTMDPTVAQGWIGNAPALDKFMRGLVPDEPKTNKRRISPPVFKTWRTVRLGTALKTPGDFRRTLSKTHCGFGRSTDHLLKSPEFEISADKMSADLVKVTAEELGFKEGARRTEIYQQASILGLSLCPNEVGPQLRLQYMDQPSNESVSIAMELIEKSWYFTVISDEDGLLWLEASFELMDAKYDPSIQWVFVQQRYP